MPVVTPDIPGEQSTLLPRIIQKANAITAAASKTLTCSFTNPNTTGNSIIVSMGMGEVEGAGIVLTLTDSNSNTYTQAVKGSQSTTQEAAIFYATGIVSGTNTVTITISGGSSSTTAIACEIYEVSGLIAVTPGALDTTQTGSNAGSTSVTTSSVTPNIPNELAFIAVAAAGGTITAGTNWTLDSGSLAPTGGNVGSFGSESQLLSSTASVSGAATLGTSNAWASAIALFKTPTLAIGGTISVSIAANSSVNVNQIAGTNVNAAAAGTQLVGVADGTGNALTSNSTTYTAKKALDANILGTLGTAFSTAGKVDVKAATNDIADLATLVTNTTSIATSALQTTGNTSLASIKTDADSIVTNTNKLIAPSVNSGTVDATTQRTVPGGAATGTKSNVASSASSVTILASNTSRKGAVVYNDSTQILYLDLSGGTASNSSYSVQMPSQSFFEVPGPTLYNGAITGIWASANGNARVTEFS